MSLSSTVKALIEQQKVARAYKEIFEGVSGQVVLKDLMRKHRLMGTCFSKDPYEHAFNEGERNVVLRILTILHVDLAKFQTMIDEEQKSTKEAVAE